MNCQKDCLEKGIINVVKNRKKALKHQLKRQNFLNRANAAQVEAVVEVAPKPVVSKGELSLDEFAATDALAGIRANLVETLYNSGITSPADFSNWTEKALLDLKGIGPATIKKLQENGVTFKA